MKKYKAIQLKAIFLLIVFSLNTIIGFACAVGVNMGFNSKHHGSASHNVKPHHHHEGSHTLHNHSHSHIAKSHHANEVSKSGATEKDDCCNDNATRLSQSDKLLVNTINTGETPVALIALHFLYISNLASFKPEIKKIQEIRPFILDSRGIRVSIQSFQI